MLAVMLGACGGGGSGGGGESAGDTVAPVAPPATTDAVVLKAPVSQILAGGKSVALSATTVSGSAPTWTLGAGNPGSLSTSTGATVTYVPPASITVTTPVTITAMSGGASQSLTLTLYPEPGTPALSLIAGGAAAPAASGPLDGQGSAAKFTGITGISGDGAGNFFVADRSPTAQSIRKVSASGNVTTLISTVFGDVDGDSAHAQLNAITQIYVAADGSIYLLEDQRLRKLANDGSVTTLFNGGAYRGLAVAADGTVYLMAPQEIDMLSPTGVFSVLAGQSGSTTLGQDGQGTGARFSNLNDIALRGDGNLYLLDAVSVRKLTPAGLVTTVAGVLSPASNGGADIDGPVTSARFATAPTSLAFDAAGDIVISELYGVRMISASLQVSTIAYSVNNNYSSGGDPLRISGTNIIVAASPTELRLLNANDQDQPFAGRLTGSDPIIVDGQGAAARFEWPQMLAATPDGSLYVLDDYATYVVSGQPRYNMLRKITPGGLVSTVAAPLAPNPANPYSTISNVMADRNGSVYLLENLFPTTASSNQVGGAIYKLGANDLPILFAGVPSREKNDGEDYELQDGSGANAHFNSPTFEGFDQDNNLYLRDLGIGLTHNQVLFRKLTPQGVASTIAALPTGLNPSADGSTDFYSPGTTHDVVYRTTSAGVTTVVAGVSGQIGDQLGALPGLLTAPTAVVQLSPATYAVISGNRVLRMVVPH